MIYRNKQRLLGAVCIACWCHQLNTLPDKCRLNWWLNCTKKFSMNPIEILEILAIAVHRFSEMPWLRQTLLRTVQMSAGRCSPVQPDSAGRTTLGSIQYWQNRRKIRENYPLQVTVSWLAQAPALSSRSVGKLGRFLCCIELAGAGHNIYHNIQRLLSAKHSSITSSLDKF